MNLELWQFILSIISFLLIGGGISSIFFLRYGKRKAKSDIIKAEEDAKQEQLQTESTAISNANQLIQMYKEGMENLKALYDKNLAELTKRCETLEEKTSINTNRIAELEGELKIANDTIKELREEKQSQCETCKYAKDCKKRAEMLLKN